MKKVLLMVAVCLTLSACSKQEDATSVPTTPPADASTNAVSTNK